MIIDIQKGGFAKGLIEYHEKKVLAGKAVLLYNDTLADSTKDKVATFLETAELNERIRVNKFLHISVSFNKEDRDITPDKMREIGQGYLTEMGIIDTPVLMYQHGDKKHVHFHIVTTTMDYEGKKIPDAHDHYRSQRLARKMEKELGLTITQYESKYELKLQEINATKYRIFNSISGLKENPSAMKEISDLINTKDLEDIWLNKRSDYDIQKIQMERGMDTNRFNLIWRILTKHDLISRSHKETMIQQLEQLKQLSSTRDEFLTRVEAAGIYVRKIATNQNSYALTFGLPEHNFYAKEKTLPVAFRYDYLYTDRKLSMTFDSEQQRKYLKRLVTRSLYKATSPEAFEKNLFENNVTFEYASNTRGVYGISFRSGNVKEAELFKGSELDRSLSWNNISSQLNENNEQVSIAKTDQISNPTPKDPNIQQLLPALGKLTQQQEDEDAKARRKKNDQDQDLERD